MKNIAKAFALLLPVLASVACGPSLYRNKPVNPVVNDAVTQMWAKDIRSRAKTGDWILTRSYSAIGDAIVLGSRGEELSHAAIYDASTDTVIEAVGEGVREVPLEDLLERNRVAIVVRPHDTTTKSRLASIERARSVVGNDFDYTGLLGAQSSSKFYCSELVVWASGVERGDFVVTPSSLAERGEIIYLSGIREDAQLQRAALARERSERQSRRTASR